jgi:hypothetical protein
MTLNLAAVGALLLCVATSLFHITSAEDPYKFFNWNVTYGDIYPLGVRQRVRVFHFKSNLNLTHFLMLLFSSYILCFNFITLTPFFFI